MRTIDGRSAEVQADVAQGPFRGRHRGHSGIFRMDSIISLTTGRVDDPYGITMDQEREFQRGMDVSYQVAWMLRRVSVLDATKELVLGALEMDRYDGDSRFAEFGCGAYGVLNNLVLDGDRRWSQLDINPSAVKSDLRFSRKLLGLSPGRLLRWYSGEKPDVRAGDIYGMPFGDSTLDMVVGCNSWDSIYYFAKSVEELSRVLKPGGRFVHYQDLGPGAVPLIMTESSKRRAVGLSKDVPCEFFYDEVDLGLGGWRLDENLLNIETVDKGMLRADEYLHRHLSDVLEGYGFGVVRCEGSRAECYAPVADMVKRFRRVGHRFPSEYNHFELDMGKMWLESRPDVPEGSVRQVSYAHRLVAEKR